MDTYLFFLCLDTLAVVGGAFCLGWVWGQARQAQLLQDEYERAYEEMD